MPDFQNFARFSKFCPIFKISPNFQKFYPFSKFCTIFRGGSCGCQIGWPGWSPTGTCVGCRGPSDNTSWFAAANLSCSDDANIGISQGTSLVIVNIWNLVWTWYSLILALIEVGPHLGNLVSIWGIWSPWEPNFLNFPIFSILQRAESQSNHYLMLTVLFLVMTKTSY